MLKKSLIFGSVALLLTALIALTGCSQATEGNTTVLKENYIYGVGVTAEKAQAAITNAIKTNRPVILADGLQIQDDDAVVDFTGATVRVEGTVTLAGGNLILNTAHADVSYVDGGVVIVGAGTYFIYNGDGEYVTGMTAGVGTRVQYTTNPLITTGTADHIAVDNYEIVKDFGNIKPEVTTIFVLDTLTVSSASAALDGNSAKSFRPLGKVDVTGNNAVTFDEKFIFGPGSTLVNTNGDVTIGLPLSKVLRNIAPTGTLTIAGAGTALNIKEVIQGPGTVVLTGAPGLATLTITRVAEGATVQLPALSVSAEIGLNEGDVGFTGALGSSSSVTITENAPTGEVAFPATSLLKAAINSPKNDGKISFAGDVVLDADFKGITGGTGTVEFNGKLTTGNNPSGTDMGYAVDIGTDVYFKYGLTRVHDDSTPTDSVIRFGGNVNLAYNTSLDFGNHASAQPVTLAAGKVISVAGVPLLGAGEAPVVLTPTGASTGFILSNPSTAGVDEALVPGLQKTLVISEPWVPASTGNLRVLSGAILSIPDSKTIALSNTFSLTLEDGAGLQFAVASPAVKAGILTIGDTQITSTTGAVAGILTAQGGAVTFEPNTITGLRGAKLIPGDIVEEASPVTITVDPPTAAGSKVLTLRGVDLDLQTVGSLALSAHGNPNSVVLAAGAVPGKITFSGEAGSPLTSDLLTGIGVQDAGNLVKPGNGIIVTTTGGAEGDLGDLISISGGVKTSLAIKPAASVALTLTTGAALVQ